MIEIDPELEIKELQNEQNKIAQRVQALDQERQTLINRIVEINGIIKYMQGLEQPEEIKSC